MYDTSHAEVTWAGVQKAFQNVPFFASIGESEQKRLHQVLSRLRIEYDLYDFNIEAIPSSEVKIAALEKLRRCWSGIAELRNASATARAVTAALEHAADQRAKAANLRISGLNAEIDGIHRKASFSRRISKKELANLRQLVGFIEDTQRSLPFDPADPSAPFLF